MRRRAFRKEKERRQAEARVRGRVAEACRGVQAQGVPMAAVTRRLYLSERTVRRWRAQPPTLRPARRGRRPQWATRAERNEVYQFLRPRGTSTPLAAVRAAFPNRRRDDLKDVVRRFRRVQRRKAERHRSWLEWLRPGTVWAADFKEWCEPIEGRYGWIFSVKDLASRCQLVWLPVGVADGDLVRAVFARLFAEHGVPLVLKMDNGGPFRDDDTKRLLAGYDVVPLFSPKRRPRYNGGVERANGQVSGYQQAVAEFRGRRAGPTREDAETARQFANELAHPYGWRGPTAAQLWTAREPVSAAARSAFLATVAAHRSEVRAEWQFATDAELTHDEAAAVDRHAVRDALVEHGLLRIHPRRRRRRKTQTSASLLLTPTASAGILQQAMHAVPSTVAGAADSRPQVAAGVNFTKEEAHLLRQ
jgi:hypothetical protein